MPSDSATGWCTPPRAPPRSGAGARCTPCRRARSWGCPAPPPRRWACWTRRRSPAPRASATGRTSRVEADVSVGEFVEQRMGTAAVVDRLVEPLLGGVYAGHARRLSLQAAVPALWAAARSGESISVVAERAASAAPATRGPVFAGISGGVFQLARTPDVGPHRPRRAHPVRHDGPRGGARRARAGGWSAARCRRPMETLVDAVILAVPASAGRAPAGRGVGPGRHGCSPRSPTRPWPS